MSIVASDPALSGPTSLVRRFSLPAWAREPLLHFVILGGVLFAIDYMAASREDNPRVIVIDAEVDRQAREIFKTSRGREPTEKELSALRNVWLDNEVMYREGIAMQLDKGDKAIRERVIFKALSVINAGVKLPPYDDATLRAWFERNRARYDEPVRYDFEEAVLAGKPSESDLRAFAQSLNEGRPPEESQASLRVFTARPHDNLVQSYGEEFAKALESAPAGEWLMFQSNDRLRVMRLQAVREAQPANYEALRGVVLQDWTDATMAEQRTAAVRALAKKYTIEVEDAS